MPLGGMAADRHHLRQSFVAAFMLLEFAAMGALSTAALDACVRRPRRGLRDPHRLGIMDRIRVHALSVPGMPAYDTSSRRTCSRASSSRSCQHPRRLARGSASARTCSAGSGPRRCCSRLPSSPPRSPGRFYFFDAPYDQILFSGQTGMSDVTETLRQPLSRSSLASSSCTAWPLGGFRAAGLPGDVHRRRWGSGGACLH